MNWQQIRRLLTDAGWPRVEAYYERARIKQEEWRATHQLPRDAGQLAKMFTDGVAIVTSPPEGDCQAHALAAEHGLAWDNPDLYQLLIDQGYTFAGEANR